MAANVSENEETDAETKKTKVSDSGYSNSCSNSQSQCSNSSKSRHSISSGSSGYGGHPSTLGSSGDDHKKKKTKVEVNSTPGENVENVENSNGSFTLPLPADKAEIKKTVPSCIDPAALSNLASPSIESEALQVGVLAQTLFCIKTKTKTKTCEPLPESLDIGSPPAPAPVSKETQNTEMIINVLKDEIQQEKEFCVVVSLADGTVVYTTPSLTNVLGFPKDMWIGRSLVNFMHPKDRIAFASHITSAMAHSHFKQKHSVINNNDKTEDSDYFYCWIRVYNGLKTSGFNIAEKKANYLPCQLSMNFKEVPDQGVLLVATSRLVKSAYKVTSESLINPRTFTTRHTANTLISHVDNEIVSYFGYLPHDMIGRSIFDFYYTEDLPYLKDVYTNVIMEEGPLFLSRPYKFRCQNGDCVLLETEWSSFINPWGKKLEFIIGRHKVLLGPQNADVVSPVLDVDDLGSNEEELTESKVFQEEIKVLLSEPIVRCYEPSKQQLAQLVESLGKISSTKPCEQSTEGLAPVPSAASEMLGEISPHHVYSDSKSSSAETPPSYTQLTYNENIQRFFASEPKTADSDESPDPKTEPTQSSSSGGEDVVKSFTNNSSFNSNSDSCLKGSGKRSGNSSGPSSNSTRLERTSQHVTAKNEGPVVRDPSEYRPRILTEALLYRHNENMNKQMAQKHKKEKNKSQIIRKHKSIQHQTTEENTEGDAGGHGMKRSVSHSWEGEPIKAFKGEHRERSALPSHNPCERLQPPPPGVWSTTPSQPMTAHMSYSNPLVNPIMQLPCVYMPPAPMRPSAIPVTMAHNHPRTPLLHHRPPVVVPTPSQFLTHQVQYMPSLMYQLPLVPMVYTQAHIVPPTIKPRMAFMPTMPHINATVAQQPSSRATSVKGETGSVLCSFASASLIQGLSDSSKKENKSHMSSVYSPGGFTTLTGKTKPGTYDNDLTHDDTSYCSYSSLFPKTEKSSDDSMKESQYKDNGPFKSWRSTGVTDGNTILRTVRKEPSWLENVDVSADLMMRYQMSGCILNQVLQSDLETLLKFNQPEMVNEQLDQLYIDLEGLSKQLTLEESFPSSCSSGDEKHPASTPSTSAAPGIKIKKKRKFMGHDRCAMIFEEDAPMPPSSIELLAVAAESS